MGLYNVQITEVPGLQIPLSRENLTCHVYQHRDKCWLVVVQWGKLAEGSTCDSGKCPHSVKSPTRLSTSSRGLHYYPSQGAQHVGVIHVPYSTFGAP